MCILCMECDTHKYVWEIGKDLGFFFSKSIQNAIKVEVVCLEFFYNNNIKACPLWGRKIEMAQEVPKQRQLNGANKFHIKNNFGSCSRWFSKLRIKKCLYESEDNSILLNLPEIIHHLPPELFLILHFLMIWPSTTQVRKLGGVPCSLNLHIQPVIQVLWISSSKHFTHLFSLLHLHWQCVALDPIFSPLPLPAWSIIPQPYSQSLLHSTPKMNIPKCKSKAFLHL